VGEKGCGKKIARKKKKALLRARRKKGIKNLARRKGGARKRKEKEDPTNVRGAKPWGRGSHSEGGGGWVRKKGGVLPETRIEEEKHSL